MKKNIILFGLLAMMLFSVPFKVNAAVSFTDNNGDGVYESSASISAGQYGTIAAGDFTWRYSDEDNGEKTWTISFSTNKKFIYISLVPAFVSIDSVSVEGSGFVKANQSSLGEGMVGLLIENTNSSSAKLTITVITTDTSDKGCMLSVSPLNLNCDVSVPGFYFDNNGNVITEEEYNEVCGNTTPENPNDVPNSETGSVIPYVAIGGGLLAIAAVYLISRKSNKVFKI